MTQPLRVISHLAFVVPALAVGLAACEGCRSSPPSNVRSPLGGAEGLAPTLRLYFVSDLAGAIEPCGCTRDQLGGINHFGAWVKRARREVAAQLVVSAGPLFFMDAKLDPDKSDQDRAKAHALARILRGLDFAAFAPGVNDWVDGADGLKALADEAGSVPLVATRTEAADVSFGSGAVRVVADGRLKVGFVGYGQAASREARQDPETDIRQGVERAKAEGANILIALAAVGRGEAKRIADAVPELTAVVVGSVKSDGDSNTVAPEGERVGDVLIAQSANHLQSVAVLDLYVREPVSTGQLLKFGDATGLELAARREELSRRIDELHVKIASWERDRIVSTRDLEGRRQDLARLEQERAGLDVKPPPAAGNFFRYSVKEIRDSLGKDPTIDAEMLGYYKAVDEHNRIEFDGRLPPPAASDQATYIGIDACAACHPGPRQVWLGTRHSHAYTAISSQFKEFNLDCVSCHVTGYERPGGSTVTHVDKLRDVQCEVCHGPGSRHAIDPSDRSRIIASPPASTCVGCHHPPHVEQFDAVAKMNEILGPGHGRPPK
jgi:cytochrome c554/c'-like protein